MIAPGAFRNKMNTQVRNKTRELEKMKRDLVKFATVYIYPSHGHRCLQTKREALTDCVVVYLL